MARLVIITSAAAGDNEEQRAAAYDGVAAAEEDVITNRTIMSSTTRGGLDHSSHQICGSVAVFFALLARRHIYPAFSRLQVTRSGAYESRRVHQRRARQNDDGGERVAKENRRSTVQALG